ncbi:methyltransferase [Actinomycetes bacterium]|nr:methyltransferase [Actinomycetes bacterium]
MASLYSHLPAPAIEALRGTRNASLWALSPLDAGLRRIQGRTALPPLQLRRHAGRASIFEAAARQMSDAINRLGLLAPDANVLDAGCGAAAMALQWQPRMGPDFRYTGFDVHEPSINWCKKHFAKDPRFTFVYADVSSAYGHATKPLDAFTFPVEPGTVDFALAKSLFTHLVPTEVEHYLAQTRRALAPTGRALLTAFLFDDTDPTFQTPAFPFGEPERAVRWRLQARPAAAIAYGRTLFTELLQAAGLRIVTFEPGYWPGVDAVPLAQDYLIVTPA